MAHSRYGLLGCAVGVALVALLPANRLEAQPYTPGQSYFGRSNYVEYIAGDLPFILSAPHGGGLNPAEIPDRTNCPSCPTWDFSTTTDSNTEDLARRIKTEMLARTGHFPHIIICRLDRNKIDCNREIVEGAQGNPFAEQAWNEFQHYIFAAQTNVIARHGGGFYIDLHGHGHAIQRLELGYLLTSSQLNLSDATLNQVAYENLSSIRTLSQQSPLTFPQLLRGTNSFGALMESEGYLSVPSSSTPDPNSDPYFNGGYNTRIHGSTNGGPISGLQIESNYMGVRSNATERTAFAQSLAQVMETFFALHYSTSLRACVPSVWPGGGGNWASSGNWLYSVVPVSSNALAFAGSGGSSVNNLSALTTGSGMITSITFSNTASGSYTLSGNAITLLEGITNNASPPHTINNNITLLSSQNFSALSNALTFGGNITNSASQLSFNGNSNTTVNGIISGSGGITKTDPGTLALTAINTYTGPTTNQAGTLSLNATSTFGSGSGLLVLAGGDILSLNTRSVAPLDNPIAMTGDSTISGNGTLTNSLRILPFSSGAVTTTGGTLTVRNVGSNPNATNNVFRLRFTGGGFNFTRPILIGHPSDLPATSSQVESFNDLAGGDETFSGVISGSGQFRRDGSNVLTAGRTILTGANTYSGGTIVNAGTLLVNNLSGSGAGFGVVVVSNGATLGGTGLISGTVTVAGTLAPGLSAGTITLGTGLDLSAGGVYSWELAANSTNAADFDNIVLTGGNLVLGGTSKLSISFIGTASAPDTNSPFWNAARTWKIISGTSAANPGATRFPSILNGSFAAGSFTNTSDAAGNVYLTFIPIPAPPPLIQPQLSGIGSNLTLTWTAVAGRSYQVQYKDDLSAPNWNLLGTIIADGNTASMADTNSPVAQRFYRVVSP